MDIIVYIILGHIAIAAIIVGLVKGFCRQLTRPLIGLIAIIGGISLVALLYPFIISTGIIKPVMTTVGSWFTPEFYAKPIDSVETLKETISNNYLRIVSAERMYARMEGVLSITGIEMTIGNFFGAAIVNIVFEFVLWIHFYLAIKYLLIGIRYLLKKITSVIVFKSIDKILGLVFSLGLTYLIVVGIIFTGVELFVVRFIPQSEATFAALIGSSNALSFLHSTNVLGSFIAHMLGYSLVTLV